MPSQSPIGADVRAAPPRLLVWLPVAILVGLSPVPLFGRSRVGDGAPPIDQAIQRIRDGVTAALFAAAINLFFGAAAAARLAAARDGTAPSSMIMIPGSTPGMIFEGLVLIGFALLLSQRSRTASLGLLAYYVGSLNFAVLESGFLPYTASSVIFAWTMAKASRACFSYHRLRRFEGSSYRRPSIVISLAAAIFSVPILGIMGIVTGYQLWVRHSAIFVVGDLPSEAFDSLVRSRVLDRAEKTVVFYSAGPTALDNGNLLTTRRLVSWKVIGDEIWPQSIGVDQISDVVVEEEGGWLRDAVVIISSDDGEQLRMLMPSGEGLAKFMSQLESRPPRR